MKTKRKHLSFDDERQNAIVKRAGGKQAQKNVSPAQGQELVDKTKIGKEKLRVQQEGSPINPADGR